MSLDYRKNKHPVSTALRFNKYSKCIGSHGVASAFILMCLLIGTEPASKSFKIAVPPSSCLTLVESV